MSMSNKNKQKKRNAFFYFMYEKQNEVGKRLGRKVPMSEMAQHVTKEWQEMKESQKKKYKLLSGEGTREPRDCRGVPLRLVEKEARRQEQHAKDMMRHTVELLGYLTYLKHGKAMHHAPILIASVTYYTHTDDDHYVPAELSILRFNFIRGILMEFHTIIKAEIPRSYSATARKHSEDTHKLLSSSLSNASVKPADVLEDAGLKLNAFLRPCWDEDTPIYTLHDEMEKTEQILNFVKGSPFKVYSLDLLFQILYKHFINYIPLSAATEMLTDCSLDYFPNLGCEVHRIHLMDSSRFCTLSCVRRWAYFLMQNMDLPKTFGVQLQEGRHFPISRGLSTIALKHDRNTNIIYYEKSVHIGEHDDADSEAREGIFACHDEDNGAQGKGMAQWVPLDDIDMDQAPSWQDEDFPVLLPAKPIKKNVKAKKKEIPRMTLDLYEEPTPTLCNKDPQHEQTDTSNLVEGREKGAVKKKKSNSSDSNSNNNNSSSNKNSSNNKNSSSNNNKSSSSSSSSSSSNNNNNNNNNKNSSNSNNNNNNNNNSGSNKNSSNNKNSSSNNNKSSSNNNNNNNNKNSSNSNNNNNSNNNSGSNLVLGWEKGAVPKKRTVVTLTPPPPPPPTTTTTTTTTTKTTKSKVSSPPLHAQLRRLALNDDEDYDADESGRDGDDNEDNNDDAIQSCDG